MSQAPAQIEKPKLALMAKVAILSLLVPAQIDFGPVTLTPSRLVFLVLVPILGIKLLAGRLGRLVPVDVLIIFLCLWLLLSIAVNNTDVVVTFAGMQVLTILGGYLVGRATIRTVADFQALARFYAGVVLCLLPFATVEALGNGRPVLMDLLNDIAGYRVTPPINTGDARFGIERAQVLLNHPIHYGLFCSGALSLYVVGLTNVEPFAKRAAVGILILAAVFFSVSSGPFLAAMFQGLLIVYLLMFRNLAGQWSLLLSGIGIGYVLLELVSSRPAIWAIADRLAFNPWTAQVRRTLWNYGVEQVALTPWLGVGYNEWNHPPFLSGSIDNYWLALAITLGLPASLAAVAAFFWVMIRAGRRQLTRGSDLYYARVASTFVLVSLFLSLGAVAIWGQIQSMVYLLLGSMVFLLQKESLVETSAEDADEPAVARPRRAFRRPAAEGGPPSRQPRYTRFPAGGPPAARREAAAR